MSAATTSAEIHCSVNPIEKIIAHRIANQFRKPGNQLVCPFSMRFFPFQTPVSVLVHGHGFLSGKTAAPDGAA